MLSRSMYGGNPYGQMRRLQNEVNRLFQSEASETTGGYPALNVYASPEGVAITAEVPGMSADDIDISVHRDTVTLKGECKGRPDGVTGYHRRERGSGSFVRTLSLPFSVDPDKVQAQYRNGVLHMSLQRPEADKPRRISVDAS